MLYIKKILNKLLPDCVYKIMKKIRLLQRCIRFYLDSEKSRRSDKKRIFLILTPQHSNLGDHAIAQAELEFLKEYDVYEITGYKLSILINCPRILKKMLKNDLIILNGGGYLGTLWFDAELLMRRILELFGASNNIVVFPQTIFYENNEFGKEEFEKSKVFYNNCRNLILTSREKQSYEIMRNAYNEVYLIPDIVLSLNECMEDCSRSGVQFTLRSDVEKTMSDDYQSKLIEFFENKFTRNVRFADMCSENDILPEKRKDELNKHFDRFRASELVVTDRLHGMIFSAVTGTPCIVLGSKSPKVKGVYDWIFKDCEYIIYTEDFDEMSSFIESIKGKTFIYDNSSVMPYYDELKEIVKRGILSE